MQYVARAIADIKKISFETVAEVTFQNACSVFGIPSRKLPHKTLMDVNYYFSSRHIKKSVEIFLAQ